MNKNDPRVVKTLRQIDEALLTGLETTPFRELTLGALCRSALINKTTFYKYYQDKYDCLNRYLDRLLEEFQGQLDAGFILAAPERIDQPSYQQQFLHLAEFMHRRKREYTILWAAEIDRQFYDELCQTLYHTIVRTADAGGLSFFGSQRAHLELYAHLFAVHTMALFRWWFNHDDKVTVDDILWLMTGNMTYGLFKTFKRLG